MVLKKGFGVYNKDTGDLIRNFANSSSAQKFGWRIFSEDGIENEIIKEHKGIGIVIYRNEFLSKAERVKTRKLKRIGV